MPQKGRRVPPPDPSTIARWHVSTELPSEDAWNAAEQHRTLDAHQIAAGVIQNSASGAWHTWISLYGADVTSWYVGNDPSIARGVLLAIQKLFSEWSYGEDDNLSMQALIEAAAEYSTDPQATLPDSQVKEILMTLAERKQREN
jgi:hypothetical protein